MSSIISIARLRNGGIAQLARACGSYPQCPRFESRCRYHKNLTGWVPVLCRRPGGQAAKTPPFHGGNTGSIPVRVTNPLRGMTGHTRYGGIAQLVERPPHTRKVTDSRSVVSTTKTPETKRFEVFLLAFVNFYRPISEASQKCPKNVVRMSAKWFLWPGPYPPAACPPDGSRCSQW